MVFRGRGGFRGRGVRPPRFRGRGRGHSRSPSIERINIRLERSRSRERRLASKERLESRRRKEREHGDERGSPKRQRRRSPSGERARNRFSPPPRFEKHNEPRFEKRIEPRFEKNIEPRFEPRVEPRFEKSTEPRFEPNVNSMFEPIEDDPFVDVPIERELNFEMSFEGGVGERRGFRSPDVEIIEDDTQRRREFFDGVKFSPANKDPLDKPDPWCSDTPELEFADQQPLGPNATLPEFDPEKSTLTAVGFVKLVNKFGFERKWTPEDKKFHFSTKLAGAAKDWFVTGSKSLEPWGTIKKQFVTAFPSDMDYFKLLEKMMNRVKANGENLSTYFNSKSVYLNSCKIFGRKAVSCLIGGLDDAWSQVKDSAYDKNFETPEELYNYLRKFAQAGTRCSKCNKFGHKASHCPSKGERKLDERNSQIEEHNVSASNSRIEDEAAKRMKSVLIEGSAEEAIFDLDYPNVTIRESDADRLKICYRLQIGTVEMKGRQKVPSTGHTELYATIDTTTARIVVHVVPDQTQAHTLILGRAIGKYFRYVEDGYGVHFSALEKGKAESDGRHDSRRRSDSPGRNHKERHHSPGRNFKESHPFLNKFYGNPYM